jgi:hypothetical protein
MSILRGNSGLLSLNSKIIIVYRQYLHRISIFCFTGIALGASHLLIFADSLPDPGDAVAGKGDAKGVAHSFLLRVGDAVSIAACLPQVIAAMWWRSHTL